MVSSDEPRTPRAETRSGDAPEEDARDEVGDTEPADGTEDPDAPGKGVALDEEPAEPNEPG